ncbi:MAG: A/G-specific adenine glycosylase [Bacteroidales bacterium]|nr:A/G-specific adenine glycosylase [Bacteroidales bacterium]
MVTKPINNITTLLLRWYKDNKRNLPWRKNITPYNIWVSEIILQQTRVMQGLGYYYRFLEAFPAIDVLASTTEDKLLRIWQGLGYYSRARNMHKAANQIMQKHGGIFPSAYKDLLSLPGVGPYTAAAIASIAYQLPYPVLDGNVFRVVARLFAIEKDITLPATRKITEDIMCHLIDKSNPGDFNQAAMEFGALQCTPVNPACTQCILKDKCLAYHKGLVQSLPIKPAKRLSKRRYSIFYPLHNNNKVAIEKERGKTYGNLCTSFL